MDLFFNLGTNLLQRSITDTRAVTNLDFKRGDTFQIRLQFLRNSVAEALTGTISSIIFVAKTDFEEDTEPLLLADDWTLSTTGLYTGLISQASDEILAALTAGNGEYLSLKAEVSFTSSATGITSSATISARLKNDVWKGTEGTPLELPGPDAWLEERRPAPLALTAIPVGGTLTSATITVNPTGDDNSVIYTADTAGTAGNSITVAYATPAAQATTTVAVSTNAITVTPGTKARMVVSGITSPTGANGDYLWDGTYFRKSGYRFGNSTYGTFPGTACWVIQQDAEIAAVYVRSDGFSTYPDGETVWTAINTGTGTPVVTAGISSAAQVITAVNASTPAAALVTASTSGTVTGAVAAVTAANLSGGASAADPVPDAIGQLAIVTHSDDTLTEWGAVSLTEWSPRTSGILWNADTSKWDRMTITGGALDTTELPDQ